MIGGPRAALTAAGLVGPATIYVAIGLLVPLAILFRYSLNQFVPGKFMVDALTIENYVKFFTDIYYTGVLDAHGAGRARHDRDLPAAGLSARLRAGAHAGALQEPADHAGGAAAVRRQRGARGRLDGRVRQQGR